MKNIKSMGYNKPLNATIMTVTPVMAADWLTHNNNNRKIDPHTVTKYANDMRNGNFTLNPDAIAFDTGGNLVNGQHRLRAIIVSDVPTDCVVIFDFPVNSSDFLNFDCGKNRTIRSRIELAGYTIPQTAVDIAGSYLRIKYKTAYSSVSDRIEFIETNREIIEWASALSGSNSCKRNGTVKIPAIFMVGLIDAKLCGVQDEVLQTFSRIYRINDFDGTEKYNPKHVVELRESHLARNRDVSTVNVVKSRLYAFENKMMRCYIRDNLYPAPILPIR